MRTAPEWEGCPKGVYGLAAFKEGKGCLMLSNLSGEKKTFQVEILADGTVTAQKELVMENYSLECLEF